MATSFGSISSRGVGSFNAPAGDNPTLVVFAASIGSLSFGSQVMTLFASVGGNTIWYLVNPVTGSSQSFSNGVTWAAVYYNAVGLFGLQTNNGTGTGGNVTNILNNNFGPPQSGDVWGITVGVGDNPTTVTPPSGWVQRATFNSNLNFWYDSATSLPAGVNTITYSTTNFVVFNYFAFFLLPYEPPNVSDTTVVSDTPNLFTTPLHLVASDSTAVSDSVQLDKGGTLTELLGSMVTSSYKWLTSTLLTAQQSLAVQPYFTAKIIDDTIQPSQGLASGLAAPFGMGSMVTAPDGTVYAFGTDSTGGGANLAVWSDPNLNGDSGNWANKYTLNTAGDNFLNANNVYSITCSGWYQGGYMLVVWYFGNFGTDATNLTIKVQYSTNKGVTWNKVSFSPTNMPNTNYSPNGTSNLSIAGIQPVFSSKTGLLQFGCFYNKPNTATFLNGEGYDICYIYGNTGGFLTDITWGTEANSYDWTIHSLGAFVFNNTPYCVFSGYRNVLDLAGPNSNYSLWVTSITNITGTSSDLWTAPVNAMPVASASTLNENSFTFPTATVQNGQIYVTAKMVAVDSVSQTSQGSSTQVITTHTNYILLQTDNPGSGYSYPSVFVDSTGVEFNSDSYASFVLQNGYWYLGGAGWLWQYTQNNIVADVSQDVLGYQIQEASGAPSNISMSVANTNNKWIGGTSLNPGAAAIAGNRKIAIQQGYYNANGVPEVAPRNVYYIDDIQQNVTSTTNDFSLLGRDLFKKMITTVSKWTYQFVGPLFFADIFDGTFASNWNQLDGTWQFNGKNNPPLLTLTSGSGATESNIFYIGTNADTYGHFMKVFFQNAVSSSPDSKVYFYAAYIDSQNWLRLEIDTFASMWAVVVNAANTPTTLDSGNLPQSLSNIGTQWYGVYIRRYGYTKFNFMMDFAGGTPGNVLSDFSPNTVSFLFQNSGIGEYDLSTVITTNTTWQTGFTVGFGTINDGPLNFRWFSFTQFTRSNNLLEVFQYLARVAGIFKFKIQYAWRELLFNPSITGVYSLKNRVLSIAAGEQVIFNTNQMSDGEISFQAKASIPDNTLVAGFSFIFRNAPDLTGFPDWYSFHVIQASTGLSNPPVFCRFERYAQDVLPPVGPTFIFYNTPYDVSHNPASLGSLNIDLTQWHTYRIVMIGGWIYAFIDTQMVAAWNDNNTSLPYQTTGQWGFSSDQNTSVQVQEILAPNLWKPVQAFTVNPGDDIESDELSLLQTLRAWFFSDLFGRCKAVLLNSNDPSTYTYDNQLTQQGVDNSDKEYVSQVTVYGNGVSATARNTSLMAGVQTRELVINDNAITTQADAQTRANNELTTNAQYINQYTPQQINNVGAELFDVVTVDNTGNNTSGVNVDTRTYAQTISVGGGNNSTSNSITLDTGNT